MYHLQKYLLWNPPWHGYRQLVDCYLCSTFTLPLFTAPVLLPKNCSTQPSTSFNWLSSSVLPCSFVVLHSWHHLPCPMNHIFYLNIVYNPYHHVHMYTIHIILVTSLQHLVLTDDYPIVVMWSLHIIHNIFIISLLFDVCDRANHIIQTEKKIYFSHFLYWKSIYLFSHYSYLEKYMYFLNIQSQIGTVAL